MALTYLIITLVLSFVNIMALMFVLSQRTVSYYITMFHVITIANAGHLFLALSSNVEEAMLSNKLAYVGAVYVPLLFFLGELSLCNIRINKWLRISLFLFSSIVLGLALTTGWSNIYYKSVTLIQQNGITDYTVEFGPAHVLYNLLLAIYLVSGISVLLYSLSRKKNISYKNLLGLVTIGFMGVFIFLIFRELGQDMLVMPAVYLIVEYIMLIIINRISKYDISSSIQDTLEYQNESAFISVTENLQYIGCNDIALHTFPVLRSFRVDTKLQESNELAAILIKQINKFDPQEIFQSNNFQYGKKHYKSVLRNLHSGDKICGYLFRIEDDTKVQRYIKLLDRYNLELANDNQNKDSHIEALQKQMIFGMANMVESRDNNTAGHIRRTSQVVKILANELKKEDQFRSMTKFFNNLIKAAPMHDLGKIAVNDAILRKPGKFTESEYDIMKTHSEKGAVIVKNMLQGVETEDFIKIATNVVHYHHERWDGTGYPESLKGEEIPLEARIMAIADVYDALVSNRCYKDKMSYAEAYSIIVSSMGTHFDPKLKKAFINCHKELEAFYDNRSNQ